jgi:hypothetical protein
VSKKRSRKKRTGSPSHAWPKAPCVVRLLIGENATVDIVAEHFEGIGRRRTLRMIPEQGVELSEAILEMSRKHAAINIRFEQKGGKVTGFEVTPLWMQ